MGTSSPQEEPSHSIHSVGRSGPPRLVNGRNAFIAALTVGVGSLVMHNLQTDTTDPVGVVSREENEDWRRHEQRLAFSAFRQHPVATVTELAELPDDDRSLHVFTLADGGPKAETLRHLIENGWVADQQKARVAEPAAFMPEEEGEADILQFSGSGFIIMRNQHPYVISNRHVMRGSSQTFEDLMTMDEAADIAVAPGEIVRRCSGDPFELPFITVDEKSTDQNLVGKTVKITGFGAKLFDIQGQVIQLQHCFDGDPHCTGCVGKLALVVNEKDIRPDEAIGLSGSPVRDAQTDEVVGIFHTVRFEQRFGGKFLMQFSGPEALRECLDRADVIRVRDQQRYNLDMLLRESVQH